MKVILESIREAALELRRKLAVVDQGIHDRGTSPHGGFFLSGATCTAAQARECLNLKQSGHNRTGEPS